MILETAAIAVGTIIATKALEKTTEKVTENPNMALSLNNAEPLYIEALTMYQRVLGVNHPTTAAIRENLAILQRQLTPRVVGKGRLGQFMQMLKAILILPFYLLWRLVKKLIRN